MQYDYNTTRYNTSSIPQVIQCNTFLRVIRPRLPGPLHIRGRISHQANPCPPLACYSTLRFANCRPVACYSSTLHFANDLVPSVELWYCTPVTCYSTLHFANALVICIVVLSPTYLLEYVAFCQCQWYCWGWAGCWNVVPEGKPCPNLIVCTSLFSWASHQFAAYETVLAMLLSISFAIQIVLE